MSEDQPPEGDSVKFVVTPGSVGRKLDFGESGTPIKFDLRSFDRSFIEDEEEDAPPVLEPDHPLLTKFQQALKEHLMRQVEHLSNEAFELETGAKKKKADREQLGIETYEAQQLVNRQQQELEACVNELDQVCAATEQMEFELEEVKNTLNEKQEELFETEKKELHLRTEVESLNLLLQQMKVWENEVESELTINQRVFEKSKKDRFHLATEKRQLDMVIYRLMTETWRIEEELETYDMQLRVKEEQREKMAETIAGCNVDIEAMNNEHRCLRRSWNSIIVAITQRDKHYNEIRQELEKIKENITSTTAELDQTTKVCQKEMIQNERLTVLKDSVQTDINTCLRLTEIETRKRNVIESLMDRDQMMIDQLEKDLQRLSAENINKSYELSVLVKEFEKHSRKKVSIETEMLKLLEDQVTNNKGAQYISKIIAGLKDTQRNMEINLATLENSNAKVIMDMEAQKCLNEETQRFLDQMTEQQNKMDADVKALCNEMEKLEFLALRKQREIDVLTTKTENAINKQGGLDVSPEEVKILTLEKNISDAKEKIKSLQKFWLRQQGHVVGLSQQRQEQINDMNMLKKQMMLLVQKNLKINDELDGHRKLQDLMDRRILNLHNRLSTLNDVLCKKRGDKNILTKDTDTVQSQYAGKLEDSELESLKIDAELADLEEDKVTLSDQLIEMNREALTWEKKIQMAVETKKNMDKERGEGGEVGNMRAEIHRMHVRLSQLKKAQAKLIQDLEHCISRRDAMLTLTEAREKREKGGSEKTRINFTRKLDDMRNKVTQLENEVKTLDQKMEALDEEEQRLIHEISITKDDIESIKTKANVKFEKVEEAKTLRQRGLEVLVTKQKKLKVFSELSKNRKPYILYKTESVINTEYDKQKQLNNKLLNIMENLLSDFPMHLQILTRIENTLRIPLIYL